MCRVQRLLEFPRGNIAIDLRVLIGAHFARGKILRHHVDIGIRSEFARHPLQDLARARDRARHHQVAQDQPPPGKAVLIDNQWPYLPVHLADGATRDLRIVRRAHVAAGHLPLPELEIGHVDVNQLLHQLQGIKRVVGAGVIHERQAQPFLHRDQQPFQDLRYHVFGGDKVDVVAAALLEVQHHQGQLARRCEFAFHLPTSLKVLAEDAAQITAGEEDGAGAAPAAQAVFFTKMGKVAANGRVPAYPADGELIGQPVNVAVAGTERAVGKLAQRALHPAGQLARLPQRKICRLGYPRLIGGRHYSLEILWRQNQKIQIWLAAYANKFTYNAAGGQGFTIMRELTADLFVSLDGFASGVDQPPYFGYQGSDLWSWVQEQLDKPHV